MTWYDLAERYGKPIYEADLPGYTEDQRLIADIPTKVAVFANPNFPSRIIVYGKTLDGRWVVNFGQRQLIKNLLKMSKII